jgi:hypothetical protein
MTESTSTMRPASERALQALEQSAVFERCTGLLRLLRFLIDASEKDPEAMKETYVGTAFYNREATYDPRYDSIVRVNVMRLRQRLAEYYAGPGANDLVTIEIPRGSYAPVITIKPAPEYKRRAADRLPPPATSPAALSHTKPAARPSLRHRRLLLCAVSIALALLGALTLYLLINRRPSQPGFVGAIFEQVPLQPVCAPDGRVLIGNSHHS